MRQPNKEACAEPLCDVPEKRTCPPQPRINMYKDEEGKFNGTAMISRISPRSTAKSCEEVRMSDPMPTSSANSTTAASRVGPRQARQQKHTPTRSSIPEENSRWRVAIPETTTAWVADTCVETPVLFASGSRLEVRRERLWLPQDHPDVLTKPMDARADVRAFLSERSKVLHTSGLPHDTTQSELESWFTQFGGRPIAFWTCKL